MGKRERERNFVVFPLHQILEDVICIASESWACEEGDDALVVGELESLCIYFSSKWR